jgi:enoyl-CoA hydratase/carnithine racemase
VGWEVDESARVGTITLQSPATYNALTVEMGGEFESLISHLCKDLRDVHSTSSSSNVNAIVLQGQGEGAFSAGGNLEWLHSLRHNSVHRNVDLMLQFYHFLLIVRTLPVPVIAALQGPAMGAGACLALACDLRVAAPNKRAILGFPFSKLGISTGMGG